MSGSDVNGRVRIPVIDAPSLQDGVPMVMGAMPAKILTRLFETPKRDSRRKSGYQRELSTARVNKLVDDLQSKRVDLPTAVLLNLRGFKRDRNITLENGHKYLLPLEGPLYVVDGQHRIAALARLVEDNPAEWSDFRISFIAMLGASERDEMRQFYVVNSTAKSVRTDLALDLLKQQAESDAELMITLTERGEAWKVEAQEITEALCDNSPVWRDRVRFPLEPKGSTTIGSAGMVGSLKPLLSTAYFGQISTSNRVRLLDAYWKGIKKVIPEVFDEPEDFNIQKSIGVSVMHSLLIYVIEHIRSKGWSVLDPDSFAMTLEDTLTKLQGDNSEGSPVEGSDFWRVAPDGASGAYSSSAGRRVLLANLRSRLPEVEVE